MNSNIGKELAFGILAFVALRFFVLSPAPGIDAAPAVHPAVQEHQHEGTSTKALWEELLLGNQRFKEGTPKEREFVRRRAELAKGQHPGVIVLTCADSRVSPELLFDQSLGDLFVVRTAGNVADHVALGSIEYAAEHLHAHLIVVLGHEKCGAVAAAASGKQMPSANLDAIVKKINPSIATLGTEAEKSSMKGVELNARGVARDILDHSEILREMKTKGEIEIIPAVYHLESGAVDRLSN